MSGAAAVPDLHDLFTRYLAAWAARDPDAIVALHTGDTTFTLRHRLPPIEGRAAVRAAFADLLDRFPGFRSDVRDVHLGARHWVLEWTLSFVVDAATGRRAGWDCLDLVVVSDDGLVARKDTYFDAAQAARAGAVSS